MMGTVDAQTHAYHGQASVGDAHEMGQISLSLRQRQLVLKEALVDPVLPERQYYVLLLHLLKK
jgi:hypothetical protein